MKIKQLLKTTILGLISAIAFTGISVFAHVDQDETPAASHNIIDVVNKLKQDGIKNVYSIEYDNYIWEVETKETSAAPVAVALKHTEAKDAIPAAPLTVSVMQTEKKYSVDPNTLKCTLIKTETENDNDQLPPTDLENLSNVLNLIKQQYATIQSIEFKDDSNTWEVNVLENNTVERELTVDLTGTKILTNNIDD
jgi:hypothetical protein